MRSTLMFLLLAIGARAAGTPLRITTAQYSAEAPATWRIEEDRHGRWFVRMPEKDAAAASIILEFMTPAETDPADAAAYVARQLSPDDLFGIDRGFKREKSDVVVAGRKSAVLTRSVLSMNRHGDRPMMAETVVVVPAKKGYYVLTLHGPESRRASDRKAFDAVVKSFKPAL